MATLGARAQPEAREIFLKEDILGTDLEGRPFLLPSLLCTPEHPPTFLHPLVSLSLSGLFPLSGLSSTLSASSTSQRESLLSLPWPSSLRHHFLPVNPHVNVSPSWPRINQQLHLHGPYISPSLSSVKRCAMPGDHSSHLRSC